MVWVQVHWEYGTVLFSRQDCHLSAIALFSVWRDLVWQETEKTPEAPDQVIECVVRMRELEMGGGRGGGNGEQMRKNSRRGRSIATSRQNGAKT